MKKTFFLLMLVFVFACDDSDDFEPKTNAFGTQIQLEDRDPNALFQRTFIFVSITAQGGGFDFNDDGNVSFDILAQFPECARDDSYEFQSQLFQTKFIGEQCEAGVSPLDGLNDYVIGAQDETGTSFRLIIRNSEDVFQEISIDNLEIFEDEQGKRTIFGEWTSFDPDFVFDVIMTETDDPQNN
ncbi:MAG: hypothetical protein AAF717_21550 [Bacteroidota bacterium]